MTPDSLTISETAEAWCVATITERLRKDIYFGRLAPGAWLKQIELERLYRCNRILLRQALDHLAMEGLAVHEPNRGYRVPEYDACMVQDLLETRVTLELALLDSLPERVPPETVARLLHLAEAMRAMQGSATAPEYSDANIAFHRAIFEPCPNRFMVDLSFELRHRVPIAVQRQRNTPDRIAQNMEEHFLMAEALRDGRREDLRRILAVHILHR